MHGTPAAMALLVLMASLPLWPALAPVAAVLGFGLMAWRHRDHGGLLSLANIRSPWPWMVSLYLYHVAGMLWTSDLGFGAFDLQIKLPLLLLPLLAAWSRAQAAPGSPFLLRLFAIANALAVVLCMGAAAVRIAHEGGHPAQEMFSSRWSLFLHPSYFAMYLTLALCAWCLLPVPEGLGGALFRSVLGLLVAGVVLCGSKMGWGILAVVLPLLMVLRWRHGLVRKSLMAVGMLFVSGVVGLVVASPYARERMQEMLAAARTEAPDPTTTTSSTVRRLTWGTAWALFRSDPWLGTGTGDIKNELVAAYARKGYTGAAEHRLNAHDQFLQTAACLGIGGALILAGMLLVPLASAGTQRWLGALFLLVTAANWVVESMLEVQAGALFFAVFACLLPWEGGEARTSQPAP